MRTAYTVCITSKFELKIENLEGSIPRIVLICSYQGAHANTVDKQNVV